MVDVLGDLKSATSVQEEQEEQGQHQPSPQDLQKTAKWNILRRRFLSASWCYDELKFREKYHSKLVLRAGGAESQGEPQQPTTSTTIILEEEAPAATCENIANNP